MGLRDELINEIAELTDTQKHSRNDGSWAGKSKQSRELGSEQCRAAEKTLTGSTDYSNNKGEVLENICEEIGHNERKNLRTSKVLSVDGLKALRDSLQQA